MRIVPLLPHMVALASLAAAGFLTGCSSMPQRISTTAMDRQADVGGILKFGYNTPTPTTAWDTGSGTSPGETVLDDNPDTSEHAVDSIALLRSLRRGDGAGDGGSARPFDRAPSARTPNARPRIDTRTERAYLSASLARLSTDASVGLGQPSNVATVTQMPDFTHMPVGRPVARPVDMQP